MKAMQLNRGSGGPALVPVETQKPETRTGEILVQVCAAGVTPTHSKFGTARMGAIPGHEFSGVIAAIGKDAQGFQIGDEVYGMNDWFADGAVAEFCITLPRILRGRPLA